MRLRILSVVAVAALAGCAATMPSGPSVAVMPAVGKPFEIFVAEDNLCRGYALQSAGAKSTDVANNTQVKNLAIGTAVGAAAGALAKGSDGAGVGAAVGLLAGAAGGAGEGQRGGNEAQRRYDIAYLQCMYSKGNQLPQSGNYQPNRPASSSYPPPPPPPGN